MSRLGITGLVLILAGCATSHPVTVIEKAGGAMEGVFPVRDFGAVADGVADDTAAIQRAIDNAAEKGGTVYLPPGRYHVAGSLQVKPGVMLKGANAAPMSITPLTGTILLATGGRDDENAPALFEMNNAATVTGLTVFYPDQKVDDIHPYSWSVHMQGFDTTLENVTFINSYNGIKVGPEPNVRHRIRSVVGCVLRRGLLVDACTDIGRVENVQFHCHWWSDAVTGGDGEKIMKYMVANLEAFVFGRTDWEYVTNNFVFPAKIGWRFIKTDAGTCNGHFTANGADACETSIQVDDIQPMGLLFTGGQYVAFLGTDPAEVRIAPTCTGNVRFVNCSFWGPSSCNAILRGKGTTSFSDCYFSSWEKKAAALVVCEAGRLQINNSTFATPHPADISLGPNIDHAIIQGNNGAFGVRIRDNSGGKAVIANNEPEKPLPPKEN
jgi:hypothetical protein